MISDHFDMSIEQHHPKRHRTIVQNMAWHDALTAIEHLRGRFRSEARNRAYDAELNYIIAKLKD